MSEWKPIETAPKTGEWVLLRGGNPDSYDWGGNDYPPFVVAHWREWDQNRKGWYYGDLESGFMGNYEDPTHWMPIPEALKSP